ncbi:MAG: hypothetical protein ACRENI_02880 [Gemmatimonadaceae bacterium]
MATKLEKTIKREIEMDGQAYMVTISPEGVKVTQKGYRKGREISWKKLWDSGSEGGSSESGDTLPVSGTNW